MNAYRFIIKSPLGDFVGPARQHENTADAFNEIHQLSPTLARAVNRLEVLRDGCWVVV